MNDTQIIEELRGKLAVPGGRHLYGLMGSYRALARFARKLHQARMPDGGRFPVPLSANRGILAAIPDAEFRRLVEDEAKRPEPTAAHVAKAFERFLRAELGKQGLIVLSQLELLFSYHLELNILRALAADERRIVLLLPARRASGRIIMFPDLEDSNYVFPASLIAANHCWEIED